MITSPPSRRTRRGWLLPAVALLLSGCVGGTPNVSSQASGPVVRTAAAPPAQNTVLHSDLPVFRIEARPLDESAPVQTQHLIIATVSEGVGKTRRKRRIDWQLQGAGSIVKVDDGGLFAGWGSKVENQSAVSYTDFVEHRFPRGTLDPNEDVVIRPGETWCLITSAVEGDTRVTAVASEIDDPNKNKVTATTHWVDAAWHFPAPAAARTGNPHLFTTLVSRRSNHQPLAGYRVRYRILDGPPALLLPTHGPEAVAVTDLDGNASVSLAQTQPCAGANRVSIEIMRPADPRSPIDTVIVRGESRIEWEGPLLSLSAAAPPAVALGGEAAVTFAVTNNGQAESQEMTLRAVVPDGLQLVRSDPPAIQNGTQLIWTLPALTVGRDHTIQAVFRGTRAGTFNTSATVMTRDGLRQEAQATTQVTVPQLALTLTGLETGIAGTGVRSDLVVSNPGTGAATNVVLTADFDATLEHESKANPLKLPLGTLAPGEARTVPLTLTPLQPGKMSIRAVATADGNLSARAQHGLTAQKAVLRIDLKGPDKRYQNRPADWTISVGNAGETPLANVVVRNLLPPELAFVGAGEGGRFANNEVNWLIGTLAPGATRELTVRTTCVRMTPKAVNVAVVTADPGLKAQTEAPVEINGLPAFKLEVQDSQDPVEVSGRTSYRIVVHNQGTLAGNVELTAVVPAQLQVLTTVSPGQARMEGNRILFPAVASLAPGQAATYQVDVQAVKAGDARFVVELRSQSLPQPVIGEESTIVYAAGAGPAPPTRAEPPVSGAAPGEAGQPRPQ